MFDLESLSLKELKQLHKDVEAAIAEFKDREKRKVVAEVEAFARERGVSPSELAEMLGGRKARKTVGAAKYANPADPSQTWTGRGRKPAWVIEALAAGKSMDSMAI
jgi:DNA-binding protein H-NS